MTTRVAVVEDHVLVRQSLVKMVSSEEAFEVVGEAGTAEDAVELVCTTVPDVAILDIELGGSNGLDAAERIRKEQPDVRILFLTMHDDDSSIRRAITLGTDGFVPKTAALDELIGALKTVASGETYLSPAISRKVMNLAGGRGTSTLTDRELAIMQLMAGGLRHEQIAEELYVSAKTVKNHLTNIYMKLGVRTAAQAVAAAYRLGLVGRSTGHVGTG